MGKFLIIGQGGIGKPLANRLAGTHLVKTVARSWHDYPSCVAANVEFLQKDACDLACDELADVSHLAIIVTPTMPKGSRAGVQDYQNSYLKICKHIADLAKQLPDWGVQQVLFVSSTAVYGENQGELIDETTQAVAKTPTAQVLLAAEAVLRQVFGDKAVIVRVAGIYHHASTRLIHQAKQAHRNGVPSHHYTNRIFADDLVKVLYQILLTDKPKRIYLACDGVSVSSFEVLAFLADKLGYPPPVCILGKPTGKKIVPNIDTSLLEFADYKAGYGTIIQNMIDGKV